MLAKEMCKTSCTPRARPLSLAHSLAHPPASPARPQTNPLRTATPSACSLINSRRSGFQIFTSEAAEIIPENRRLHRSCVSRLHVTAPLRGFLRSMHIRLLAQFRRICFRIQLQALTPAVVLGLFRKSSFHGAILKEKGIGRRVGNFLCECSLLLSLCMDMN
jgi:hypothetical protein